jgi:single-stranded DNA-specific DHH superfamily exonuclease
MLTDQDVALLREEIVTAKNPLVFYDGDGDGLCSFLLLYSKNKDARGVALTSSSNLDVPMLRKVDEFQPDKIFVLDIPLMTQEFVDQAKRPIFWIDHHPPQTLQKVKYFNPRNKDPNAYIPTSRMMWQVVDDPAMLWVATAGCLADHYMPEFIDDFIEKFPYLLPKKFDLDTILFKKPVGRLVKLFFFLQKGPQSDTRKSVKILTRIKSPDEIFKETSPAGKFLHKRFENINTMYEELLVEAKKSVNRSKLILFYYSEQRWSFTANLANELSGLYPDKVVLIARRKSGEMKCSLRGKNVLVPLQKSLEGLQGGGGGHPDACGAVVKEEDWEQFLNNFRRELK